MRSFNALALGLTLVDLSAARVANAPSEVTSDSTGNVLVSWFNRLFRKDVEERAALDTCPIDAYYTFAADPTVGKSLCQALMHYPNETVVTDYAPTSTYTNTISTRISTVISNSAYTPVVTVTESPHAKAKRDVQVLSITVFPRAAANAAISNGFDIFRRQVAASSSSVPGDSEMSASFSSACACQTYGGSTVTSTFTHAPAIATQNAVYVGTTTVVTTRTAAPSTTTVTIGATSSTSSSAVGTTAAGSSSAPPAIPTNPAFTCPEDNNTVVSQMVGTMRYDYLILCDFDLSDTDIYTFSYTTLGECAAACSTTNTKLNGAVCKGFSYYESGGVAGSNCFLKTSAGSPHAVAGVDSGLLQSIAEGLSKSNPAGTTTESGPFSTSAAQNPSDLSSIISTAMANSSTTISTTRPPGSGSIPRSGLLVNAPGDNGITSYSTYVSDGTTVSGASTFSTAWTSDGIWYYTVYSTWSQSWASATIVYAASETGSSISNSSESSAYQVGGGDSGDYSSITTTNNTQYFPGGGYHVTQVISNVTYNSAGSQIASTATTNYYSYSTGGAGGAGGMGGSGAGLITSSYVTTASTGAWSTYTVISNGGSTGGAGGFGASGAIATPAPSVSTIINTYSTAYSSGYLASGAAGGAGGGSGTQASGAISPSSASFTPISSTIISEANSGAGGIVGSGALAPISSTVISGVTSGAGGITGSGSIPSSPAPFTPISSTVVVGSTGGFGGTGASGAIPSTVSPFTNSGLPRSGAPFSPISSTFGATGISGAGSTFGLGSGIPLSSTVTPSSGAPFSPFSSTVVAGSTGVFGGSLASGSIPSTPIPFTNSGLPRSRSPFPTPSSTIPSSGAPFSPDSTTAVVGSTGGFGGSLASGRFPSTASPFTNSELPRSGSQSSSLPLDTVSLPASQETAYPALQHPSYAYGGIIPASGTGPVTVSLPVGTAPASTASPFTNSNGNRSGSLRSSSSLPSGTGPLPAPTGSLPLYTGPSYPSGTAPASAPSASPFTNSELLRSGTLRPSGSALIGTAPILTGPGYPVGTAPIGTAPIGTAPLVTGTAPLPSTASPFTNSELPRSGSLPSSSFPRPTGTAPSGTGPAPGTSPSPTGFPPYPTAPASCVTKFLGTTTILTTITHYGCYRNCPPAQNGYGNSPNTFGPPQVGGGGGYGNSGNNRGY